MRSLAIVLTGALCVAVPPNRSNAQQPPDQPAVVRLTLDAAIVRALEASHRIGELRGRPAGARAPGGGSQAADRPQVSAQAGYTRTNHVDAFGIGLPDRAFEVIYPDIPNNYRTRLDLQWPIYTFGRTAALERLARAESEATGKDVEVARADLKLDVTRAFWALVTAGESVRVLEESVKRMDASLQDVRNRLDVGLVPPNDVLSVQAQRSRQQMLLIQARNQLDLTSADLARLAGLPSDARIEPDATLEPPPGTAVAGGPDAAQAAQVGPLVAEARLARPDRQALAKRVAEAGERREAALAVKRPVLGVAGGIDYARPNPRIFPRLGEFRQSWDASLTFSWLLWDGGRVRADIAEATAGQRALTERLADFDSALEVDVRQRWLDLASSRAAVAAALDAVNAAAEARRVVGERFASGVATSTDVLDAQMALLQAELDRTQALASVKLAEARLNRALGR
jgi:outer membrane protein